VLSRHIAVRGTDLALAEAGAGGRPLLLVHGIAGAKEDFTEWLDRLAERGYHAVAFDQRGHGESASAAPGRPFSLLDFAEDVVGLADELDWPRFTLLGHSMGGMVAQLVALEWPARLDALVLMDTGPRCPDGVDASLVELGAKVVREGGMAGLIEAQRATGPGPLDSAPHQRVSAERPGYGEWCDAKTLAASPDMWIAISAEIVNQPDRLEQLRSLAVPTLVLVGAEDQAFVAQSTAMSSAIPGAALAVIAGGGHSPQFESPDAWWEALTRFLDKEVPA
jgi:pimeloyl-ACP methyl ester carboxylesterase